MNSEYAFTTITKQVIKAPFTRIGKIENQTLFSLPTPPANQAEFIRKLREQVPPAANEILVYRWDGLAWELCNRLIRGWSMAKLPKNESSVSQKKPNLSRYGIYSISEVLDHVVFPSRRPLGPHGPGRRKSIREYDGFLVKMDSLRYRTFAIKGTVCLACGLVGQYFALESHRNKRKRKKNYHFNLYGVDANGDEVLFTKDHRHPKSKGGPDKLSNLDTMCIICNSKKGDSLP